MDRLSTRNCIDDFVNSWEFDGFLTAMWDDIKTTAERGYVTKIAKSAIKYSAITGGVYGAHRLMNWIGI